VLGFVALATLVGYLTLRGRAWSEGAFTIRRCQAVSHYWNDRATVRPSQSLSITTNTPLKKNMRNADKTAIFHFFSPADDDVIIVWR
jgi:hypothetical protein